LKLYRRVRDLEAELALCNSSDAHEATPQYGANSDNSDADAPPEIFSWDSGLFFSKEAKARVPSDLRTLSPHYSIPGMKKVSGGLPAANLFPFAAFSATLTDGTVLPIDSPDELLTCQQYAMSLNGYAPLMAWVRTHVSTMHQPPCIEPGGGFECLVSGGSTQATDSVASVLFSRGDVCLCEEFTYSATLTTLTPRGVTAVGVPCDAYGLIPTALDDLMSHWLKLRPDLPKPRVLYTIPNGQNPCGTSVPRARKAAIYACCQTHGLVIVEDDAYFYLQ
jgi:DNA-binding transcriptional MocR family regulator